MRWIALLPIIMLPGCMSQPLWYKPNTPPAMSFNAATDCEVEALRKVPPSNQLRTTPVYTTPMTVQCNQYTNSCSTYGGNVYGGQTYSVDANAGLRQNVIQQCMAKRGWQLVNLPPCGVKDHNTYLENPAAYRKPKTVDATSCAILDQARNEWVIFTP